MAGAKYPKEELEKLNYISELLDIAKEVGVPEITIDDFNGFSFGTPANALSNWTWHNGEAMTHGVPEQNLLRPERLRNLICRHQDSQ